MKTNLNSKKFNAPRKVVCSLIAFSFSLNLILPPSYGQEIFMPAPGAMVWLSPGFEPTVLKGMTTHPENPFLFDFIVDRGQQQVQSEKLKVESEKLVKYFLASLTIPDKEAWVNLSPYEKDRIIPDTLGSTEMGKQMLEQDYLLKQLASSLTNPETELGSKFWNEVNKRMTNDERQTTNDPHSTFDVPRSSFSKVWIVPDGATVAEVNGSVFITQSRLKVMMEEDYLATSNVERGTSNAETLEKANVQRQASNVSTEVFREIILPQLEKEVNEGKNFAATRQVYQSVILASWYKQALKESLLGKIYMDKAKLEGVDITDKSFKQKVYEQYLEAFKKGVYNIIKEETPAGSDEIVPRKYFSGGLVQGDVKPDVLKGASAISAVREVSGRLNGRVSSAAVRLGETNDEGETIGALAAASAVTNQNGGGNRRGQSARLLQSPSLTREEVRVREIKAEEDKVYAAADKLFEDIQRFVPGLREDENGQRIRELLRLAVLEMFTHIKYGEKDNESAMETSLDDDTLKAFAAFLSVSQPTLNAADVKGYLRRLGFERDLTPGQALRPLLSNVLSTLASSSAVVSLTPAGQALMRTKFYEREMMEQIPNVESVLNALAEMGRSNLKDLPTLDEEELKKRVPALAQNVVGATLEAFGFERQQDRRWGYRDKSFGQFARIGDLIRVFEQRGLVVSAGTASVSSAVTVILSTNLGLAEPYLDDVKAAMSIAIPYILKFGPNRIAEMLDLSSENLAIIESVVSALQEKENGLGLTIDLTRIQDTGTLVRYKDVFDQVAALASSAVVNIPRYYHPGFIEAVSKITGVDITISDRGQIAIAKISAPPRFAYAVGQIKKGGPVRKELQRLVLEEFDYLAFDFYKQDKTKYPAAIAHIENVAIGKVFEIIEAQYAASAVTFDELSLAIQEKLIDLSWPGGLVRREYGYRTGAEFDAARAEAIDVARLKVLAADIGREDLTKNGEDWVLQEIQKRTQSAGSGVIVLLNEQSPLFTSGDEGRAILSELKTLLSQAIPIIQKMDPRRMDEKFGPEDAKFVRSLWRQILDPERGLKDRVIDLSRENPVTFYNYEALLKKIVRDSVASSPSTSSGFNGAEEKAASSAVGGIDFDPSKLNLQIKRDGKGVPLPLPQQDLQNINIKGLFPIIINIQPIPNVPAFLGMQEPAPDALVLASG